MAEVGKLNFGPPILREWADRVVDAIKKNRPVNGRGTTVDDGPDGRPVNITGSGDSGSSGGSGGNPYPTGGSFESGKLVITMSSGSNIEIPVVFVTGVSFDGTSIVAQKNDGTTDEIETEECP